MKRIIALLIGLLLAVQAAPGLGEESPTPTPLIIWHTVAPRPAGPVGEIEAPEITIDGAVEQRYDITFVAGDNILLNWHAEGEVKTYHVTITGQDGREIRAIDTNDEVSVVKASELKEDEACTLTVTAIPVNGTLAANGLTATMRFALYTEPVPTPTPTPTPEPTPTPILESWPEFLVPESTPEPTPPPTSMPEPELQTGAIRDSWAEIIAAIDDGTARQRYAVGATKALDLGDLGVIHMQLAGFDLDERSDGYGKAATTWIAVELLPEAHVMNEKGTIEGGWRDSDLRAYLHAGVYQALPESVRSRLVKVNKQQWYRGNTQITGDLVWIPNYDELFGEDSLYYGLFQDKDENRRKQRDGSAASWWLRSADYYHGFSCVSNGGGGIGNYGASGSYGVAVGFCL